MSSTASSRPTFFPIASRSKLPLMLAVGLIIEVYLVIFCVVMDPLVFLMAGKSNIRSLKGSEAFADVDEVYHLFN